MAQYDVHGVSGAEGFNSVVFVQGDFYDFIDSRLAIPLFRDLALQIDEIVNPVLDFERERILLKTEFLGPFSAHRLGPRLGSLDKQSYEIIRAIDRLMTGF